MPEIPSQGGGKMAIGRRRACYFFGILTFFACIVFISPFARAGDLAASEQLFTLNCAVCHGGDRGGYIGPALTKERHETISEAAVRTMISTGIFETLMPIWAGKITPKEIRNLAALIKNNSKAEVSWSFEDIKRSLEVYIEDEKTLPRTPEYAIEDMNDLMAVMSRGRYATGNSKVIFFDGQTNQQIGEIPTAHAPHILDFDPADERWAYVKTDAGWVYKVDLYSMRAVRGIRVGLNGPALAVSYDGRYVMAGSFVPNTAVILDAKMLEPIKFFELGGIDPDGKMVESDSGIIISTPSGSYFAIALENAGQVWIIDHSKPEMPVTEVKNVGHHLHDAFLAPNGRYLLVSAYDDDIVAVIDLEEKKLVKRLPAGCQPHVGSGAVVKLDGKTLGFGTNIRGCDKNVVSVWDLDTWEVVKQIPVIGPTESPAAHPKARYVAVDIVGTGPDADKIQVIDKETLEVAKTITVGGHAYFPEYTARGDYIYISAGYHGDKLVIYKADTLEKVQEIQMEAPAGIFSHVRPEIITIGLDKSLN
jgi:nitrite reductase (NO-forming)/hydroxylamine reductase